MRFAWATHGMSLNFGALTCGARPGEFLISARGFASQPVRAPTGCWRSHYRGAGRRANRSAKSSLFDVQRLRREDPAGQPYGLGVHKTAAPAGCSRAPLTEACTNRPRGARFSGFHSEKPEGGRSKVWGSTAKTPRRGKVWGFHSEKPLIPLRRRPRVETGAVEEVHGF